MTNEHPVIRSMRRRVEQSWRRWKTRPNRLIRTHRLQNIRFIDKPLLFVSELQRSGGTLTGRLLDGHPQLYAHPHELWIGRPDKSQWPALDLSRSPREWFFSLREDRVLFQASTGLLTKKTPQHMPFMFSQDLQKEIFLKVVDEKQPKTQRQVLDCYVTSYFNAWLDYQGLNRNPADIKFWSVFTARLASHSDQCSRFFADYPDCYLLTIIRNPLSWFASARRHWPAQYGEIGDAVGLWKKSVEAYIANAENHPGRVFLLDFDTLITRTAATMKSVCERIGLDFDDSLTRPSFNGLPIGANSSFDTRESGKVLAEVTGRGSELNSDETGFIEKETGELYRKAKNFIATVD